MSKLKKISDIKAKDFWSKRKVFLIISLAIVIVTLLSTFILKLDIAIEFKGGTIITYTYTGEIDETAVKNVVEEYVGSTANVTKGNVIGSDDTNVTIEFTSKEAFNVDRQVELSSRLNEINPEVEFTMTSSDDVSPTIGKEFFIKCLVAVLFASLVLIIYITFSFKKISGFSAAVCALIALLQDLIVVYATFVIFGFPINSNFMAVILTILGYSINDTIVIYDRIRENKTIMPKAGIIELVNISSTQSMRRSIRTSITTISTMLIVSVVVLANGYTSLLSFTVPLMFGMISGTYSSLCVAPMLWVWWNERKAKKNIKQ